MMAIGLVYSLTMTPAVESRPQFSNLRVLSKDLWRPLANFYEKKNQLQLQASSRSDSSSPIKRVAMANLMQQLIDHKNQHSNISQEIVDNQQPTLKESIIRRVMRPSSSFTYSRNLANSTNSNIRILINPPHLTTTTSTEPPTEPPTTTTTTTTTTAPISKKKSSSSSSKNNWRNNPKSDLSQFPNSPIFYIKLPSSSYVPKSNPRLPESWTEAPMKPIFVATTVRSTTTAPPPPPTTTEDSEIDYTTTTSATVKPTRTNSRIIKLKGPFVFNGKPGGIYSAPAPYRPPNYLDLLHDLYQVYPKLKRAQFIK